MSSKRVESIERTIATILNFQRELDYINPNHIKNVGVREISDQMEDIIFELEEERDQILGR